MELTPVQTKRFWSGVLIGGPGCWEWQRSKQSSGYGQMFVGEKNHLAHRISYSTIVGPIPTGLQLDHLCRNRACVRPDHLEPVTGSVNLRRSPMVGRNPNSHKHTQRKL